MATLKSDQFTASEKKYATDRKIEGRTGQALHYEFSFPSTVAAGDNLILGYLDNNYVLPELGQIVCDGGATALTVDIGWGTYNVAAGTLDVSGSNGDVDAFADGIVVDSANTYALSGTTQPAGVFTRVAPSNDRILKRVVIATAVAETSGEDASLILDLPVSPNPTS